MWNYIGQEWAFWDDCDEAFTSLKKIGPWETQFTQPFNSNHGAKYFQKKNITGIKKNVL